MKDEALALIANVDEPTHRLNLLREYLQAFVLRSLHESEAFSSIAFVGGTALRFLHRLPRFSEDLDFSVHDDRGYRPKDWLSKVRRDLELAAFDCKVSFNAKKTVNMSWIRVSNLLQEADLAARSTQKLSIKLEIDTRPPAGAEVERTIVARHLTFALRHYAISSLMAGKLHALLTRPYAKGRDWFDLAWYRAQRPPLEPNETLLQNALDQTQSSGKLKASNWRKLIRRRAAALDIEALRREVAPFLERSEDRQLLSAENLEALLRD